MAVLLSRSPPVMPKPDAAFARKAEIFDTAIGLRFMNRKIVSEFGTDSMPETAENAAAEWGISRADQDVFALSSQNRATAARDAGRSAAEIVPVTVNAGRRTANLVSHDEHINPNGGAIALGHPPEMTDARFLDTAAYDLTARGRSSALCSLCVDAGQGVAVSHRRVEQLVSAFCTERERDGRLKPIWQGLLFPSKARAIKSVSVTIRTGHLKTGFAYTNGGPANQEVGSSDIVRMPMGEENGIFYGSGGTATSVFWVAPTRKLFELFEALDGIKNLDELVRLSALHEADFLPPSTAA